MKWTDYLELTKPKVVLLIVFTAMVGMLLASEGTVPLDIFVFGLLGIGLAAASGAANAEHSALICEAMEALETADRAVLVMRHINRLKMEELALALFCSVPTARSRLRAAAERFARQLRKRGILEDA